MRLARRTDPAHETALQVVLDRLTGGVSDRVDMPDGWITAVRALPARSADYAPFPAALDERLCRALRTRGIEQLYTHQASGRRACDVASERGRDDTDGVGQDAVLQRPGPERHPSGSLSPRAVPVSQRRRSPRISSPNCTSLRRCCPRTTRRSGCLRTTGTRRRTRAARFAGGRMLCSPTLTCCTRGCCRIIHDGRSSSRICDMSSSTSCTPIAACSAAIWRMCCAGCTACVGTTVRRPPSSAHRRRSRILESSPSRWWSRPSSSCPRTERHAARRCFSS